MYISNTTTYSSNSYNLEIDVALLEKIRPLFQTSFSFGDSPNQAVIVVDTSMTNVKGVWTSAFLSHFPEGKVTIFELTDMTHSGQEPPAEVVAACRAADFCVLHTHHSLTHTKAGKHAIKNNGIGVSLPGVSTDIMQRTFGADYRKIHKLGEKIKAILEHGSTIKIENDRGTSLSAQIRTDGIWNDGGILKPGGLGNLPAGEVFFAPILGTAEGTWVIEASLADEADLDAPVVLTIKKGMVVTIDGGAAAQRLHHKLKTVGPQAFTVAEIGIGTNPDVNPYGNIIEAEKALGTAHLALGNSSAMGGEIDVPIHLDGLTLEPTITVDSKQILQSGQITI